MTSDTMEYDVVIVGAGPAGLSAAIRLKQQAPALRVCVLEKGGAVGAHILSGCVFDPRALNHLFPDWSERGAPLAQPATHDRFMLLTSRHAVNLPLPPSMHNHGCHIISLAELCRWLAGQAEALGVEIFAGFPAAHLLVENERVVGVQTGDMGRQKDGLHGPNFQPGVAIRAAHTLLAEGCRGQLSEQVMRLFHLRQHVSPQTYGIGIKEIWELAPQKHTPGHVLHTLGWPLDARTYGGGFAYHMAGGMLALGLVVGLDYANPHLDPYMEFQRFKHHPAIAPVLEGARRVAYGARALNEGGLQAMPGLTFPGGALIGCAAGFLNVARIKGSHTAMMSGMLAAEALADGTLEEYPARVRTSWVWEELHAARNLRPAFHRFGLWGGLAYAALDQYVLCGRAPWTLHHTKPDHACLKPASDVKPIAYPKPDGVRSFDRMSSVYLSGTNHEENQLCHLRLKNSSVPESFNWPRHAGPEARYCPAGVYEYVNGALHIHAQNCVHCKTCDIKDPAQNITWTAPEGGGGPNYSQM